MWLPSSGIFLKKNGVASIPIFAMNILAIKKEVRLKKTKVKTAHSQSLPLRLFMRILEKRFFRAYEWVSLPAKYKAIKNMGSKAIPPTLIK